MRSTGVHIRRGFTQVDLYVILFLTVLFAAYFCIVEPRVHEGSNGMKCAANLKQIGNAMLLYANENGGNFPRTTYDPADPVVRAYTGAAAHDPFASNGPQPNDVTAALYLLLRTQDIGSAAFTCPWASPRYPLDIGPKNENALNYSNFPSEKNLSYSIANPYPSPAAVKHGYKWTNTLTADFALVADMNPGTPQLWTLTPGSRAKDVRAGNSRNHPSGQNVLFGDLHVDNSQTPLCGVQQDNIYGPGGLLNAGTPQETIDPVVKGKVLAASPAHKDDSVLLPVATSDPGTFHPTPFTVWWGSGAPRRLVGWAMALITGAWVVVGWRPIVRALYIILRDWIRAHTPAQRRLRAGLCPKCGYDVRASPVRCPECGHERIVAEARRANEPIP
jgi:hypothetical protein